MPSIKIADADNEKSFVLRRYDMMFSREFGACDSRDGRELCVKVQRITSISMRFYFFYVRCLRPWI